MPRRSMMLGLAGWLALTSGGCDSGGSHSTRHDAGMDDGFTGDSEWLDAGSEEAGDLQPADLEVPVDNADAEDIPSAADAGAEDAQDKGPEVTPLPPLPTRPPLGVPSDPLAGLPVESCAVYLEERCDGGVMRRCSIYDTVAQDFVSDPDPLLRRAFLFDRWRDLYNSPDGQAVDRDFRGPTPPGTPESEWSRPDHFEQYWGAGDGGIWTGWSTVAAILRYSQTGTEADYQRMEQHVRDLVTMYDVTGIPGYLCRFHFLVLPDGAPNSPDHILRWEGSFQPTFIDHPFDPTGIANLPPIYTEGIRDEHGKVWKGQAWWHGRPSIDQNTGPMTALPMAYDLLRDEDLRARIAHHLTCYLKRLQRVEIVNLQSNQQLLDALIQYFSVGELKLDPDDLDLTKLDRIVGYVHRQINSRNEATFDRSCPQTVQMTPWRVVDAASETFLLDILEFVMDMGGYEQERENGIDHFYFPSLRGGDAMHLMHLATIAYHFTGDEQYRRFLYEELIGNLRTVEVAHTAGAFDLPKFCKKYYGDQITYGPWWAFLHLLGDCDLRTQMQRAYHREMWEKLIRVAGNVDFNLMYAGALAPEIAVDRDEALAYALEQLSWMGGNGGLPMGAPYDASWLDEPRRSYRITPAEVMAFAPEGIEAVCPTPQELAQCAQEIEFMGIQLPNLTGFHTYPCTGSEWECPVGDGKCTDKMASGPLPVPLRPHTDYLWQRNPFALGKWAWEQGRRQYAGSDYSVPYWNARRYGFITEGVGQVLAWETVGVCESHSGRDSPPR